MDAQVVHRPGAFKQTNKPHKLESGKTSRRRFKGKSNVKNQSISRKHVLNRDERKNKLNQIRKVKREVALKNKRRLGCSETPPIIVMVLALSDDDPVIFLESLKACDDELKIAYSEQGNCHISSRRLKQRFTFITPRRTDLHALMDAVKVSETLLLLHSAEEIDDYADRLLSVLMAHALPTPIHVVQGFDKLNPKKKAEQRKNILKNIESKFPDAKLYSADTRSELQLLLRQIGAQKVRPVAFRDSRFHMLAEKSELVDVDPVAGSGTLKVSGYIRGQALNVNSLVHIPGWGTFQMSQIINCLDPFGGRNQLISSANEVPDPLLQESLQSEVEPDPMEGEQTWPTEEELEPEKAAKKVVEGTSDYQSCWIVDSEEEGSESESSEGSDMDDAEPGESEEEESDKMEEDLPDTESVQDIKDENYDKDMDFNEEKQTLVRFKEERMNQMFPDELDTPIDIGARVRFQKYRGLKSFKNSPWDAMENLPLEYARIYRFEHFKQTKKKVLKSMKEELQTEVYVTLCIKDVPLHLYETESQKNSILVVYGMLPHEQKMSVVNCVIRKHPTCQTPIKSKDKLIFHVGYTRFTCKPIFSEHRIGNKFKYERFLPPDNAVVASFYAPVIFPPASVVVFRLQQDGTHELVATGSVFNVDPNRIVVKRVVLSGHPFRIFKRAAVVRYMFFNKDDINWFKKIELYTKYGRRGEIRESLGSHGHMKCVFDKQLNAQDVVLMSLYKRVYPKWTYELYNPKIENSALSLV